MIILATRKMRENLDGPSVNQKVGRSNILVIISKRGTIFDFAEALQLSHVLSCEVHIALVLVIPYCFLPLLLGLLFR